MSGDPPSALAVIIDVSVASWGSRAQGQGSEMQQKQQQLPQQQNSLPDFGVFVDALLAFLQAFVMLHRQNLVTVLAAHKRGW